MPQKVFPVFEIKYLIAKKNLEKTSIKKGAFNKQHLASRRSLRSNSQAEPISNGIKNEHAVG